MMTKDESHKELLDALRKNLDSACSIYSASRRSQLDDVRFYMGSPDNQYQWPSSVVQSRSGSFGGNNGLNARPCLTINKINPHVKLLANDIRRNKAGVKVVPEDDRGSVEVADILGDIIRGIEYDSDASIAYETASENQLVHGEGYIRIYTDYVDDNTFEQKIGISRIKNSFSVFMDPSIQQPCGKDARWCIVTELVPIDEYEALYPKYKVNDFSWNFGSQVPWFTNTHVRLAEYFYKDCTDETLLMYMTGDVVLKGSTDAKNLDELGVEVLKSRKIRCEKVKWFKTNGVDILEEGSWAGDRIPITRVVGNEYSCDGIIEISGHVRNSKDAQRMYNYWASQEAEMLALAPKAPFVGYVGQFEGLEDDWSNANNRNIPYLQANPVTDNSGSVLPLPQRSMPPMASSALLEAKRGASEDIKDVTGQYNASLGMTSNERSGRAIFARQGQSDLVNYHYPDNLARAIKSVGEQLVDLIPKIYGNRDRIKVVNLNGDVSIVGLNSNQDEPVIEGVDERGQPIKSYNLSLGKYGVRVEVGPYNLTKRQEAVETMGNILQTNPELWKIAGDLFVKNMDWPGARELSDRLLKTIPPEILDVSNPQLKGAQLKIEELTNQMAQMQGIIAKFGESLQVREVEVKEFSERVDAYNAETNRLKVELDHLREMKLQSHKSDDKIEDMEDDDE